MADILPYVQTQKNLLRPYSARVLEVWYQKLAVPRLYFGPQMGERNSEKDQVQRQPQFARAQQYDNISSSSTGT
ncbi:hypothetical protein A1O1_05700 [Capronia coronata CBS 617.96]|uniref:Uncharacterized protein n=1 Tax=Capronia coronata CBS 617.96 TaxID=1182541 RepID=W9Y7Z6_9EURO|nr:uncharacterized protein A1O1_05700 [Capronia coronata CBS 617.96]EXJ85336.1 hypothetical protein A1O1_05700 [Capronia coronata CBS 617.96]